MKKPKFITEFSDIPAKRAKMPELPLEERKLNFAEVELGYTEELARAEAARCLSCRRCIGCGLCLAECDACAIVYDDEESSVTIEADAVIFTSDGEIFSAGRKRELGYGEAANVITSLELERLTSPTGPFGGLIVRPFDGEIPRKIAFIQCVGSREEAIGANYCSTECCSRTLLQAERAKETIGDVEVRVFHRGLRPVGKTGELGLRKLLGQAWIDFIEAAVSEVKEDPKTGAVAVRYLKDGQEAEDTFDLVVLAVGLQATRDFRRFARVGGVAVNKFGFVDPSMANLIAGKEGVAFAGPIHGPETGGQSIIDAIAGASKALVASGGIARSGTRAVGANPLIYACEYGLQLAGSDGSLVAKLKAKGFDIGGVYPFLCYKGGRDELARRLNGTAGLVVLGCHSCSHEGLFAGILGLPPGRVVILGQREIADDIEDIEIRLRSAIDGLSESRPVAGSTAPLESAGDAATPRVVAILGGGVSGLAAAGELGRRGVKVVVIEKSDTVGASFVRAPAGAEPAERKVIEDFVKAVEASPDARILKSAELASVERRSGAIRLRVSTPAGDEAIEAGALIVATGSEAYQLPTLEPSDPRSIISQDALMARLARGEAPWGKVVMLQCVGARDAEHPYCSRFCCRQALTNALAVKQVRPEAEVTILHRGIRVYGADEELYTEAIERGVRFLEIAGPPTIGPRGPGSIAGTGGPVRVALDLVGGASLDLEGDLLVLSLAHGRSAAAKDLSGKIGVPLDRLGFFEIRKPYADPFATPLDGVFACGFARTPVTAEEAFLDGIAAAGSACRYLER